MARADEVLSNLKRVEESRDIIHVGKAGIEHRVKELQNHLVSKGWTSSRHGESNAVYSHRGHPDHGLNVVHTEHGVGLSHYYQSIGQGKIHWSYHEKHDKSLLDDAHKHMKHLDDTHPGYD